VKSRAIWITLVGVAAFVAFFLARLPAEWIIPKANANASCAQVEGTIWTGLCAGLVVGRRAVGDVAWEVHPSRLLLGELAAHLTLKDGIGRGSADLALGFGDRFTARNLVADFPLDPAVLPGVPSQLRGRAHLDLTQLKMVRRAITELQGRIEARDLIDRSGSTTPLGSYVLTFPGGPGEPTGKLRDLEGPLAVEGTVRLTRTPPGFELEGLVAARPGAPPELVNNIRFLGSPDATGRRPFAMTGTF